MTTPLLKPALYEGDSTGKEEAVRLKGGRCKACGYAFFPLQRYGCEQCGAFGDALSPVPLDGIGTLLARVTVHLHGRPERTAPFVVGTVRLDDGPVVRTLLDALPEKLPPCGARMRAALSLVPDNSTATAARDLRFSAIDPIDTITVGTPVSGGKS